jgi:hypothetical protein
VNDIEYRKLREWLQRQAEHEGKLTLRHAQEGNGAAAVAHGNRREAYQDVHDKLPFVIGRQFVGEPTKPEFRRDHG